MFKDKDVEFSVNLSVKDILEAQIYEYIFEMLETYDIGSKVVFEIVESESIENFDGVINFINHPLDSDPTTRDQSQDPQPPTS